MSEYSATDKTLHRLYLGNYFISRAALEIEEILHGKKAGDISVKEFVIVTGLARSGTTAVMRHIFETKEYASLQYSNMPFILNPNLWSPSSKIEEHERAHKDGIRVDGNSPEEFDEYFWKVHLKDAYIKEDGMILHKIDNDLLEKYRKYVQLICLAKGKEKYLSKNNNSILRLHDLRKLENNRVILLFRDPISHASSLFKLHKRFSEDQRKDPFILQYFDYLGHHEFGLHHKPFLLSPELDMNRKRYGMDSINYWLAIWLNYYSYLLEHLIESDILLSFEDLISDPERVYGYLHESLGLSVSTTPVKKHIPSSYSKENCDEELIAKCYDVYEELGKKKSV